MLNADIRLSLPGFLAARLAASVVENVDQLVIQFNPAARVSRWSGVSIDDLKN